MSAEVNSRLWERAFQLSYFILRDRNAARECVASAVEKLAAQRTREKRRSYWRARKQELTIRRISRPAEDTLQWLVFLESERLEREQESQGTPPEADLVVRYIKHLAQLTTVNSSFHVNIGFNRLLRKYTTAEVQQIYELATQRYPGAEEYRKAKGKLLNQLATRFERFLKVRTATYGELQFESHATHQPWSGLVDECLELFTPWSGHTSCLQEDVRLRPERSGGNPEKRQRRDAGHAAASGNIPDRLETSRCHWFMHSTCYGRLAEQVGCDPPRERLSVPRFLHHDGGTRGSGPGLPERRTAPLSQEESRILHERVASVMAAGGTIAPQPLKIVAHGAVCARLDPARNERRSFEIPDGTRLLELRSDTRGSDRILATHWIDYAEDHGIVAAEYTIPLRGGRQLSLSVSPRPETGEGHHGGAVVTVESHAAATLLGWSGSPSEGQSTILRPILTSVALVAVGVLASVAYFALRSSQDRLVMGQMAAELAAQKATIAELKSAPKPPVPLVAGVARYAFSADLLNLRGGGNAAEPVVSFAPGDSMVILELPVSVGERGAYRARLSSFPQEQERLTEVALQPVRHGDHWIVEFALPAALVEADTHYLLALTQNGSDSARYLFKVQKK